VVKESVYHRDTEEHEREEERREEVDNNATVQ
jgi:hypothetical protein